MIHTLKNLLRRTSFVLVATLIVAVHPAVASADTIDQPAAAPATTQSQAADTTPADPAAQGTMPTATDTTNTPTDNNDVAITTPSTTLPSTSTTSQTSQSDAKTTTKNTAEVTNTTNSTAQSGNATVANNDHAGNATSGNATVNSTTINNSQSSSSFNGSGNFATFNKNIDGSQVGDILLDPSIIAQLQVESSASPNNLTVNNTSGTSVNNDITLNAQSGNATVDSNDTAGNATTGDANAVANVVNFVNSMVGASKTFVGVININGSLDGDILIPDEMKNLLNQPGATTPGSLEMQNTANTTIENNVNTTATSGNATVNNNDTAGNATSGNASTNVTLLNLTGHEVVGANSMVVFVNVHGTWVGFIVDAPGSNVAALGSGVTSNTTATDSTKISNTTNTSITNNVDVTATSGDATVSNNDHAGNATTGSATASANILNVSNSSLSMGGWFGILFINVFGSWNGSFGEDTAAGGFSTHPAQPEANPPSGSANNESQNASNQSQQNVVLAAQAGANSQSGSNDDSGTTNDSTKHKDVLGASTNRTQPPSLQTNSNHWVMPAVGLGISALLIIGEILRSRRKARKMQFAANTVG
jgi:hypothetical protein